MANKRSRTERPETEDALVSADVVSQKVEEFGDRVRRLQAREVDDGNEWLEKLERRHETLKSSLEDYNKDLIAAAAQVQANYQHLREYVTVWAELANAFNRAFGGGQKSPSSVVREQDEEKAEEPHSKDREEAHSA